MIEALYDLDNLNKSLDKVSSVSGWKERTQKYKENRLFNIIDLQERLENGTWRPKEPWKFIINERGKTRVIESYSMEDRIVQRCLVQYVLLPVIRPKLIYDNDASLTERGTSHFRKRLTYKLKQYAKENGNNGYVLLGDFSKFYDNIQHDKLIECFRELGIDEPTLQFIKMILDAHKTDVSYMTDEEYANCMDIPFNSVEYELKVDKSKLNGTKLMAKGTGIGSHLAQLAGIALPYRLDNYIKIVKGVKIYGRFNDDFYVVHESKAFLKDLLGDIERICKKLGIILNKKKTQIVPLSHKFTILQTQYFIADERKVIEIPSKKTYSRERKRLRGLHRCYLRNEISFVKIQNMYLSWRESMIQRKGSYRSIQSIDAYFLNLFGKPYDSYIEKPNVNRHEIFSW